MRIIINKIKNMLEEIKEKIEEVAEEIKEKVLGEEPKEETCQKKFLYNQCKKIINLFFHRRRT